MTTLDELKEQVEDLRHVVRMADSDSVETRQLLRAQTQLMMALRSGQLDLNIEQHNIKVVLGHQAEALGGMLLSLTSMQDRFNSLSMDVAGLRKDVTGLGRVVADLSDNVTGLGRDVVGLQTHVVRMDARQDRVDERLVRMDQRQDRMDARQDRMDRNVAAIMRHLGVEPPEES